MFSPIQEIVVVMLVLEYVCFWCGADLALCECDCGVVRRQTVPVIVDDGTIGSVDCDCAGQETSDD